MAIYISSICISVQILKDVITTKYNYMKLKGLSEVNVGAASTICCYLNVTEHYLEGTHACGSHAFTVTVAS